MPKSKSFDLNDKEDLKIIKASDEKSIDSWYWKYRKRYLKILTKKKVKIGVFDKKKITFKNNKILFFNNFSEIKYWSPHGVIISTNTDSHLKILFRFKYFKTKFFLIEKPIAIKDKKISNLKFFSKNYNKKIFVVSNLRYFYNLNLIKKFLKKLGNPISAKSYFGHNLLKQKVKTVIIIKIQSIGVV